MTTLHVAAFYRFTPFEAPADLRQPLYDALYMLGVRGTVLLADEGVNGTIAGSRDGIEAAVARLRALPGCAPLSPRLTETDTQPFHRLKVRLKREIVTMGMDGVNPNDHVGRYIAPEDWNAVISDPDTVVIDTRNDYEVGIGMFKGAINPQTESFRDFPAWFEANRADFDGKRIAMYCTGGIRCEKATSHLKTVGIDDVLHLKGGILSYLETVPQTESLWRGDCFVFDQRVAVNHDLAPSGHLQCFACKRPVDDAGQHDARYVEGVSCAACHDTTSDEQKRRFAERQRQVERAEALGVHHIGHPVPAS